MCVCLIVSSPSIEHFFPYSIFSMCLVFGSIVQWGCEVYNWNSQQTHTHTRRITQFEWKIIGNWNKLHLYHIHLTLIFTVSPLSLSLSRPRSKTFLSPEPSKVIPSVVRPSTSVIEIKPPPTYSGDSTKPDIKPTKPVSKPTKQLSSVVRVVSAANPSPSIVNTSSKSLSPKVQIVSSHAEVIDENKNGAAHKSVVHVEAIDGNNGDSHELKTISASRVEVVDGISPIQSYVVNAFLRYLVIFFLFSFSRLYIECCLGVCIWLLNILLLASNSLDATD